jgi:hypothetical protein
MCLCRPGCYSRSDKEPWGFVGLEGRRRPRESSAQHGQSAMGCEMASSVFIARTHQLTLA